MPRKLDLEKKTGLEACERISKRSTRTINWFSFKCGRCGKIQKSSEIVCLDILSKEGSSFVALVMDKCRFISRRTNGIEEYFVPYCDDCWKDSRGEK